MVTRCDVLGGGAPRGAPFAVSVTTRREPIPLRPASSVGADVRAEGHGDHDRPVGVDRGAIQLDGERVDGGEVAGQPRRNASQIAWESRAAAAVAAEQCLIHVATPSDVPEAYARSASA